MANILPVSNMIEKPDYLAAAQQGLQFGSQLRQQREQRADEATLRNLAPQVIAGDPGATAQAAVISPDAAGKYRDAGDSIARRAEGFVRMMEDADKTNPQQAQSLWQTYGVPFARQFSQGTEPTANWTEAKPMLAHLKARIEMAKAAQGQGDVKVVGNALVDTRGNPIYQAPREPKYFQTDQGLIVVDENGPREVRLGAGGTPPPRAPGEVPFSIDPNMPAEDQAGIRANEAAFAAAPDGATIQGDPRYIGGDGGEGQRLLPASSVVDRERLRLAQEAADRAAAAERRAAEAAARAKLGTPPPGMRWNADMTAVEQIPGSPPPASAKTTEDQNKAAGYAKRMEGALADIAAVTQTNPSANRPGLDIAALDVLPDALGNYAKSGDRQRVEAAQLDALDAALTLNTGAAYTKEQLRGLSKSYFAQPGDDARTVADKQQRLQRLIETARIRAGSAAQPPMAPPMLQDRAAPQSVGGGVSRPTTDADYAALPSGSLFIDPDDGKTYRKP